MPSVKTKVATARGIRQGCKLAPLLWVAISTAILHELGPALSGPHKQGTTFADDTLCQWLIETEQDVHDFAKFLAHLLQVMRTLGLHVNLTKTALLIRARGSRRLLSLTHRLRIWRACAVSSATFGLTPLGMTYPAATLLRGWFYKQLRAVTFTPAHISHVSNEALSAKHGIPDPVDQLEQSIRQKRDKLRNKEEDITSTAGIQDFWEQTHLAYQALTTTALQASPVVPVKPTVTGLACAECGVYFTSTKTLRQHLALKHKQLVTIDPEEAKHYQSHQHSLNGMPQCKHCKKNLQTWGSLRNHVLTYACRQRARPTVANQPPAPASPTEGTPIPAPHEAPPKTPNSASPEHREGEANPQHVAPATPASHPLSSPTEALPVLRRLGSKRAFLTPRLL